ncbi:MAG: Cell division protein FtsK/SpoIIIE, partial [Candidatus Wolfebacteria bacterium GW2011_GWC1_37_10]
MSKRKKNKNKEKENKKSYFLNFGDFELHPETKKGVWAIILIGGAIILFLASFNSAGPAGSFVYNVFNKLFGWGYYLLPLILLVIAGVFLTSERQRLYKITFLGAIIFVFSGLGLIDIISPRAGGLTGKIIGSIEALFGYAASIIAIGVVAIASLLVTLNLPIKIRKKENMEEEEEIEVAGISIAEQEGLNKEEGEAKEEIEEEPIKEKIISAIGFGLKPKGAIRQQIKNYIFPPVDLLKSSIEKPTVGDLRASANIIKRTLESFGIPVEMGEINIGPKVTRYTLKPAEGIKLSRIMALNSDLALAVAAHPIRIEAPIPGKSLVGIEVPNKVAAIVRLGSLMNYPEFANSGPLGFILGRDVNGDPIFADIEKMPHALIAGSTGSGKSIAIHSLLISLLYKNSPEMLKMILIDPKRVELSVYDGLPHLIAPVITEPKKTINVFRWAIAEMDRRYEILLKAGSRDIQSYNKKNPQEAMSYILIVIDELADLMSNFGRDIEGAIVRLAQMARATGIHLVVSTQRPSVEVITGLIKANITTRIALQVASQVDSRTILDSAGAEKLLGGGDMLFVSSELSKPKRIQGSYISEEEISKVADFIRKNNKEITDVEEEINFENIGVNGNGDVFEQYNSDSGDD